MPLLLRLPTASSTKVVSLPAEELYAPSCHCCCALQSVEQAVPVRSHVTGSKRADLQHRASRHAMLIHKDGEDFDSRTGDTMSIQSTCDWQMRQPILVKLAWLCDM